MTASLLIIYYGELIKNNRFIYRIHKEPFFSFRSHSSLYISRLAFNVSTVH